MSKQHNYINSLKGKEDLARSITDQLPIAIYRTTYDGKILYANPMLAKMLEYDIDEIYNINSEELFISKKQRDVEINALMNSDNDKTVQELYLKTKSGKIIIVKDTVNIIRDEAGTIIHFDGALEDITKQKLAEEEVLRLSTAVKQSPASVIITDLGGNIIYANPKFLEVTGYSLDEVIGKNPRILKSRHTASEDYKELWETITNGKTWRGEFLNRKKDGTEYWELASISPIIDKNGDIVQYLAIKEDITERKKIQEALIDSENELKQANATKNIFFSIMAHDLKGPIGSFYQLLSLFKDNFNEISNDEKLDYINILMGLSGKTNNLLEDILLWARIQMNTLEFDTDCFNLIDTITHSKNIILEKAEEKNIKIAVNVNSNLIVCGNRDSLKTIIRNLLSNAIKFSHRDSTVEIIAQEQPGNEFVEISIIDNGMGIPKENLDKLFKIESTFTTYGTEKEKGTGLGLVICKELVNKNGGEIQVRSIENEGSTFSFTIPTKLFSV